MMKPAYDFTGLLLEEDPHDAVCVEEVRVTSHESCHASRFDLCKDEVLV